MFDYMKKRPGPAGGEAPGFEGSGESSDPAAFAQAALAGEHSRPLDLDAGIRQRMEAHFGLDFGKVRLAQSDLPGKMGVDAVAQGDLIRFAPGAYRPGSSEGERLLGHELGHIVRQSRMGPGLAGLPVDDPVSESGADNMAANALSGSAGAVHAFTPAPAASAPMEGGRLWNRMKQDTHRWLLGGKIGSWWRRRRNREAARADVEDKATKNYKRYAEPWKDDYSSQAADQAKHDFYNNTRTAVASPGFWDPSKNPLKDHPDYYPEFVIPRELHTMLADIPASELSQIEVTTIQSIAGNHSVIPTFIKNADEDLAAVMPNVAKAIKRYKTEVVERRNREAARERLENPKAMVPGGDNPENHKIWKATAAQIGGSHTNPFDDGRLAVKQEAIENAKSIEEVQRAMDKYVFGHKTSGRMGGTEQSSMNLRTVKDMAKNLAHIVEDFPDIKELISGHSGTEHSSDEHTQMFVSPAGTMGWHGKDRAISGGFFANAMEAMNANVADPHSTTSSKYSAVHEAGHLVDFALSRKLFRAMNENQIEQASINGHGSDLIIRHTLDKLLAGGNKDVQEIFKEFKDRYQAQNKTLDSFRCLDLTRQGKDENGDPIFSEDALRLTKALKEHGFTARYGSTNPMETFAEAFAKVYEQGEDADEFSKGLVESSQTMLQNPRMLDDLYTEYNNSTADKRIPDLPPEPEPVPEPAADQSTAGQDDYQSRFPEDGREYPIIVRYIPPAGSSGDTPQEQPATAPGGESAEAPASAQDQADGAAAAAPGSEEAEAAVMEQASSTGQTAASAPATAPDNAPETSKEDKEAEELVKALGSG